MVQQSTLEAVVALLQQRTSADKLTLAAIDGLSGAGKTAIAEALRNTSANASIVHGDDFYCLVETEVLAGLKPKEGYQRFFDWERLRDQVLKPLRGGSVSRYRRYDWSTRKLRGWVRVLPRGIVIVEGVYSSRPELRDYYDAKIFVDTPRSERMRRIHARNDDLLWIKRWTEAENWYIEHIRPIEYADLVI